MRSHSAFWRAFAVASAFALSMGLLGCSDTVTPNDEITVTEEDVAHQSGYVAYAMVQVLPELSGRAAVAELITLGSPFSGEFWYDTDPQHVWTDAEHFLSLFIVEFGTTVTFTFDIVDTGNGDPLTADGAGTMDIGSLHLSFDVNNVVIIGGGPVGGTITVLSSGNTATITFHPDGTATVSIGDLEFTIDLSDGSLIE